MKLGRGEEKIEICVYTYTKSSMDSLKELRPFLLCDPD